jgi:hypothetical protein
MTWEMKRKNELQLRFSGSYYIRSDMTDLDEKELRELYFTLTDVEETFRCLKSELGLRPAFQQKDSQEVMNADIKSIALTFPGGALASGKITHFKNLGPVAVHLSVDTRRQTTHTGPDDNN